MPLRKWLLSSVLWGGMLAVPAIASAAGTGGHQLQPQSAWAVSKITATRLGGGAYCALARRFDDNLVLTFARNKLDEGSIAVDFQREAIKKSETYEVSLNPGFGKDRSFSVKPVSERAIVIKLGKDYSFYDALERSGILEVKLGDEAYSFSMADMSAGEDELNSCLASLEPAEATKTTEAAPLLPDVSEAKAEPKPVQAAVAGQPENRAFQSLKEENVRLRNALERERRVFEERMTETADSSAVSELRERISLLETENSKLRGSQVAAAAPAACYSEVTEFSAESDPEFLRLKEENTQLRAQIEGLEQEVKKLSQVAQSIGNRENMISELKAEIDTLSATQGDVANFRQAALEAQQKLGISEKRVDTLKAEVESLRVQAAKVAEASGAQDIMEQRANAAESRAREAEEKLVIAEHELADLRASFAVADSAANDLAQDEISRLLHRIAALESENRDLVANLEPAAGSGSMTPLPGDDGAFALIRNLEAELESVRAERDRFAKQIELSQSTVEESLITIATDNWDLESATRRFNEAEREIRRLGMQIDRERDRCAKEKTELEYMLFDPRIATDAQTAKLQHLENEIIAKEAALAVQKDKFEEKIAGLQGQVHTLEGKLETASLQTAPVRNANRDMAALHGEKVAAISPAAGSPVDQSVSYLPLPVKAQPLKESGLKTAGFVEAAINAGDQSLKGQRYIQDILAGADIEVSHFKQVDLGNKATAFTWEAGNLFGSAEQKPLPVGVDLTTLATEYINRTHARCEGEFAAVPVLDEVNSGRQIATYEIACVGADGKSASASLLFVAEDGLFTTFAHESGVASMDRAMDIRDRLADQFRDVVITARL